MLEDVLVQFAQLRCRLDTELVDEASARGLEDRQRVGLSPRAIEREHLQLHQALLEGVRDDQRIELAEQLAVATQLEVELDPLEDRSQPLLLEPSTLSFEQTVRTDAAERLSTPDSERLIDPRARGLELAGRARRPRSAERVLPAADVALAGLYVQQVATRPTDQPAAVSASLRQRLAQARDKHLQAVPRTRGRLLAPQLIDELVAGHDAPAHQRQNRKQRPRPLTPQGHRPAIHTRLDRTEQLDLQPIRAVVHPRRHRVSVPHCWPDSTLRCLPSRRLYAHAGRPVGAPQRTAGDVPEAAFRRHPPVHRDAAVY